MDSRYMSVYIAGHRARSLSGNIQKPSRNLVNKFQNAFRSSQGTDGQSGTGSSSGTGSDISGNSNSDQSSSQNEQSAIDGQSGTIES